MEKSALVGIRTQDPSIKSAVLYQLSYERDRGSDCSFPRLWKFYSTEVSSAIKTTVSENSRKNTVFGPIISPLFGEMGDTITYTPGECEGKDANSHGLVRVFLLVFRSRRDTRTHLRFGTTTGVPLSTQTKAPKTITRSDVSLAQAIACARVGDDNKGKNIVILDLRGITPIFDFFVIMTGTSRRQIHTLAEEIDDYMAGEGEKRLSVQGYQSSRWVAQDYGDIIVHVFDADSREFYALEELWADAKIVDWKRE
mgnify:CR=1 FL=1